MDYSRPLFSFFVVSTVSSKSLHCKFFHITGFEPLTSHVREVTALPSEALPLPKVNVF